MNIETTDVELYLKRQESYLRMKFTKFMEGYIACCFYGLAIVFLAAFAVILFQYYSDKIRLKASWNSSPSLAILRVFSGHALFLLCYFLLVGCSDLMPCCRLMKSSGYTSQWGVNMTL